MERFTKGPWVVEKFSDNGQIHVYSADYSYTLHHQKKFFGLELTDIDIANASLIAAAPEMYEMLNCIRNCVQIPQSYEDRVDAVLSKARGEQ